MPSGHRRYDEETVRFLRAIKEAQSVGFTLAEIGDYLGAARRLRLAVGDAACADGGEDRRDRRADRRAAADAGRARAGRRLRLRLARPLHVRGRVSGSPGTGDERAVRRFCTSRTARAPGTRFGRPALGGAVLPWQDVLHDGPVPDIGRAGAAAGSGGVPLRVRLGAPAHDPLVARAARPPASCRRCADGRGVVLWFEHDLYDQLQLLDVLALAHGLGGVAGARSSSTRFPGKPSFRGLGELTPDELETLWPTRREVTAETLDEAAERVGLRSAHPSRPRSRAVAARGSRAAPVPRAPHCERLLEELPGVADGLSGNRAACAPGDRRRARALHAAPSSPRSDLEDAPFLGDAWFYPRSRGARDRARRDSLETEEGEPLPPPPPLSDGQDFARLALRMTESGERVLAGEADRVELLGVDRWLGGTHITPESGWRWDSAARELRS